MNRKETTAFLSDLLTRRLSGIGKYYGREVSVNWGTRNEKRIDFIEFSPPAQYCTSEIEKGIFVCYEKTNNHITGLVRHYLPAGP